MIKANAIGVTMTAKTKRIGCSNIRDIMAQRKLVIKDEETIREMSTFVAKGSSYQAWKKRGKEESQAPRPASYIFP